MSALPIVAWSPFDPWHLLVLGVVALLLFGKRLPEVGRSLGRGIAEFKKGLRDVQDELNRDQTDETPPPRERLRAPGADEDEAAVRRRLSEKEEAPSEPADRDK